jgi:alpha-galactosidase
MPILYDEVNKKFHLHNDSVSYIIDICAGRFVRNVYFGRRVHDVSDVRKKFNDDNRALTACTGLIDGQISLHHLAQEYPTYGSTDFHYPACCVKQRDGSRISAFAYESHDIRRGKKTIDPLPSSYVENDDEADSLDIVMFDPVNRMRVVLTYAIFSSLPVITRSARICNDGTSPVTLERAMSFSLDLPDSAWQMIQLSGDWSRERQVRVRPLTEGVQSVHSMRGTSSADHNPFIALKRPNTDELSGEVYGFSLVYSGNFLAQAEVDSFARTRVMMGIHPDTFEWPLAAGESFQTPEATLVYSSAGLNSMSQTFHRLYRERLVRGNWRDRDRPVLLNNWEATCFDFNEKKIIAMAKTAKELGVELFVLDDGWFGKRNDDRSGLGDWWPNTAKLPDGVRGLASKIHDLGLMFGLWIEPEMVNADSDLYRAHPDWILHVAGRPPSEGRHQFVLDFSRNEVVDYIATSISAVLRGSAVSYVKWDMNRYLTECGSSAASAEWQGAVFHKYVLGVYRLYGKLTSEFPEILFESCSAGGARYDPGILSFAPQTWTSDDTDAIERLKIQYGTSMVYPLSSMGNHVSEVPNQQVGRSPSFDTRGNVAFFGMLGYELDPCELDETERAKVREQIAFYTLRRTLVRTGKFYRLKSPFEGNLTSWIVVSEDSREAVAACYRVLYSANPGDTVCKFAGLMEEVRYAVDGRENEVYFGDELMYSGLRIRQDEWTDRGDFSSVLWYFRAL